MTLDATAWVRVHAICDSGGCHGSPTDRPVPYVFVPFFAYCLCFELEGGRAQQELVCRRRLLDRSPVGGAQQARDPESRGKHAAIQYLVAPRGVRCPVGVTAGRVRVEERDVVRVRVEEGVDLSNHVPAPRRWREDGAAICH